MVTNELTEQNLNQGSTGLGATLPASRRFLPQLLVLFVGSGCSALIYEIVWFQMLELVIGSSAVSLGVLLGTFMGGMCLGSIALPRIISVRAHPLRVYALLEMAIAIIGIAVLFGMPYVDRFYAARPDWIGGQHGLAAILLRGVVCAMCLLPPTLLMGSTLPAIARWIEMTPQGVSWLGFFYGGNIVGAVFGCLLAGFYLLRVHDTATATYVAAAINGTVALIGLGLATLTPHEGRVTGDEGRHPSSVVRRPSSVVYRPSSSWLVYIAIALSGLCALGAEVIWTRLLSLLLGATVYTFSIILAVFLMGLGIGSSIGSFLSRWTIQPRLVLGCCQMLLTAAIAWTAYMLAKSLPYWPIDPSLSTSPWFNFQLDLLRCTWAILPAAILWGASFPLALGAVASREQDPGRLVGGVYAANTVGAIVGAIAFSIVLVPLVGTQQAERLMIGLSAAAALLMFAPLGKIKLNIKNQKLKLWSHLGTTSLILHFSFLFLIFSLAGLTALLVWSVPEIPWRLVAYGRYLATSDNKANILYVGEGMNATVAVTQLSNGERNFHISGKVEASTVPQDMRLQRMLGHIAALLHPKPCSVLVVGCGAGVTAGSFVLYPDVARIVICEIEPLIPKVVAHYFATENYNVLEDLRVEVVYDDARHYILTTHEKFDIITSDPIHPWVKGSATLYTKEYFELCKQHLNPGGLITQWVPLYESTLDVVKSEIATFFGVFPNGTIWSNDIEGEGYDVVLLGQVPAQAGPPGRAGTAMMKINVDAIQQRLDRPDHTSVAQSLDEVGFGSAIDLLATYAGQGPDLRPWLVNAKINRDRNLRLQYLAGMALNSYQGELIYDEILVYRKFPEELFVGSDQSKQALKQALDRSE